MSVEERIAAVETRLEGLERQSLELAGRLSEIEELQLPQAIMLLDANCAEYREKIAKGLEQIAETIASHHKAVQQLQRAVFNRVGGPSGVLQ